MKKETDEIHNLVFFKNICFIYLERERERWGKIVFVRSVVNVKLS